MVKIPNWSKEYESTEGVTMLMWEHDNEIIVDGAFGDPHHKITRSVSVVQAGKNHWEVNYTEQKKYIDSGEKTRPHDKRIDTADTRKDAEEIARKWMKNNPDPQKGLV